MDLTTSSEFSAQTGTVWSLDGDLPVSSGLELTAYGRVDQRIGNQELGAALVSEVAHRRILSSVLVEAAEGFGRARHVRSERVEATWCETPLILAATDSCAAVVDVAAALRCLNPAGLITLEDIELLPAAGDRLQALGDSPARLTIHCRSGHGRDDHDGAAHVLRLLHDRAVAGATVLAGTWGTVRGERRGARWRRDREDAPAIVTAIDRANALADVVPAVLDIPHVACVSARRVGLIRYRCERREVGFPVGAAPKPCKLTVYTGEEQRGAGAPLHLALEYRLSKAGAPGVTVTRARWGYALGSSLRERGGLFKRCRSTMVTAIVDSRPRIEEWVTLVDELAGRECLAASEPVAVLGTEER
jgi:PII-like signaling protein